VFGNHDYFGGNPQSEINYYKQHRDNRWTFPDYQYSRKWNIPGSDLTLEIIFTNTPALCPEAQSGTGPMAIPWPTDPVTQKFIWQPTLQWIENAIEASTADILMVAGHYHAYTNTAGDSNPPTVEAVCIQERLVPLFKKYRVAAYLNGHENNLEHLFVDGVNYINSGHGSDPTDPLNPGTPPGLLFNSTVGGFAAMYISGAQMNFSFIDYMGNNIYEATLNNPRARRNLRAKN